MKRKAKNGLSRGHGMLYANPVDALVGQKLVEVRQLAADLFVTYLRD